MATIIFSHPACLRHRGRPDSPERPERLKELLDRLDTPEFAGLEHRLAPKAERGQLCRVHDVHYVSKVYSTAPDDGEAALSPDTYMTPGSLEAALRAAGAACAAVDAVMRGEAKNTFCAVRPPGHHAATTNTMGFCIFNNAAVAAAHARVAHDCERVAILDFDVHHGNGTQAIFRADPHVMFTSVHQAFIFPRSGDAGETGVGNVVNVPVRRDEGVEAYMDALEGRILPAIEAFAPDILVLSAGFDAHHADPLADLRLRTSDFTMVTQAIMKSAGRICDGRVVSLLEGGYNPTAMADSAVAHLRVLIEASKDRGDGTALLNAIAG
jgi:acetoin utilization deacetylase AcuC-like enzyme